MDGFKKSALFAASIILSSPIMAESISDSEWESIKQKQNDSNLVLNVFKDHKSGIEDFTSLNKHDSSTSQENLIESSSITSGISSIQDSFKEDIIKSSNMVCDNNNVGGLRYNESDGIYERCTGSSWVEADGFGSGGGKMCDVRLEQVYASSIWLSDYRTRAIPQNNGENVIWKHRYIYGGRQYSGKVLGSASWVSSPDRVAFERVNDEHYKVHPGFLLSGSYKVKRCYTIIYRTKCLDNGKWSTPSTGQEGCPPTEAGG